MLKRAFGLAVACLAVFAATAGAQSLFTAVGGPDPDGLTSIYPAAVHREFLVTNPETMVIGLPGLPQMTVVRDRFILREGFDTDGSLLPETDPDDARMLWVGYTVEGFTVVLTAEPGVTAGTFIGPLGHYTLLRGTMNAGFAHDHLLRDVSYEVWDSDDPDAFWATPQVTLAGYGMLASTSTVSSSGFGSMSSPKFLEKNLVPEENTIRIDVAVVWTADAETAADDTGDGGAMDINAIIQHSVDTANVGFADSRTRVRLNLAQKVKVSFEASGDGGLADREDLRLDQEIRDIRDAVNADAEPGTVPADIVSAFVGRHDVVGYWGYSFVQRHGCGDSVDIPGCDVGKEFNGFAYHLVATSWAKQNPVFFHEVSHNLGCEHDYRSEGTMPRSRASFPWSFGLLTIDFRTIMAVGPKTTPRLLLLSHPDIGYDHDGNEGTPPLPVGVFGDAYNAWTVDALAPTVAAFREPTSTVIFTDGFESGDFILWSLVAVGAFFVLRRRTGGAA